MVYGTAVRLLANPSEAEDIAQTVFLKAFERFETIGASPAAAGWLKTVTTNLCLNHLSRYRSRWRFFSELQAAGMDDAAQSDHIDSLLARRSAEAGTNVSGSSRDDALAAAEQQEQLETVTARFARPPACTSRSLSLRRQELSRNRGAARRDAREGQDRHPPRTGSVEAGAGIASCSPMI